MNDITTISAQHDSMRRPGDEHEDDYEDVSWFFSDSVPPVLALSTDPVVTVTVTATVTPRPQPRHATDTFRTQQ